MLTELPELIEVQEWLPMSAADADAYRTAVRSGNFMAMRQAAMLQGSESAKLQRLTEIVGEAEANQRRVIVFSHFRDVLDLVARSLPGPVFGPLTGSVPAARRQQMVDGFSAARHGAVLVAQIVAGGVGLNIQSASVIIICEPQLKPTTEAHAVARAHRMGQVQSVQVQAVSVSLNPRPAEQARAEAHATASIPAAAPVPRLLHVLDDGEWVALVHEDVEGRHPRTPWVPGEMAATVRALEQLATEATPAPGPGLPRAADLLAPQFAGWALLAADRPADLDPWVADHLDDLRRAADRGLAALIHRRAAGVRGDRLRSGHDVVHLTHEC